MSGIQKKAGRVWIIGAIMGLATLTTVSGCKKTPVAPPSSGSGPSDSGPSDAGSDPAAANLAPVDPNQPTPDGSAPTEQANAGQQQGTAPCTPAPVATNYNHVSSPAPTEQATQPPPPLPEYQQPPAPEPNDLWTPGYWGYAPTGYYWVPGVWVAAPYTGALWTPPYWGWFGGHYLFHRGYWGPHIGFYGGVNYGFGYTGRGYEGGYWNGNSFYYNRSVTHINESNIHNVYNHEVIVNNYNRVSYNGGNGGTNVRPTFAETAALNERHAPPVEAQAQIHQQSAQNRQQFFNQNQGHPAQAAFEHPAGTPENRQELNRPAAPAAAPANVREPQHTVEQPRTVVPQQRTAQQQPRPQEQTRPQPQQHPQAVPRPVAQPHPQPQQHAPQAHPQAAPRPVGGRPEERPR